MITDTAFEKEQATKVTSCTVCKVLGCTQKLWCKKIGKKLSGCIQYRTASGEWKTTFDLEEESR
jgi:hypothetical protein